MPTPRKVTGNFQRKEGVLKGKYEANLGSKS